MSTTSPGDGTALWLWSESTAWVDLGSLYRGAVPPLLFASPNVFAPGTTWSDPGFMKQTTTPFQANYGFPTGLPFQYA